MSLSASQLAACLVGSIDFRRQPRLDPRVHLLRKEMDCRVKPGNDPELDRFDPNPLQVHHNENT